MSIIVTTLLDEEYPEFKRRMAATKTRLQNVISRMAAGAVESDFVISFYRQLGRERDYLETAVVVPGLEQFAKDYEDDQGYDVVTEINATIAEMNQAIALVDTTFPQSGGYVLYLQISDGVITPRTFSTAATAGLRAALDDVVATIG